MPHELTQPLNAWWNENPDDPLLLRIGLRFQHSDALPRVIELATAAEIPPEQRLPFVRLLAELGGNAANRPLLLMAMNEREPENLRLAALVGLQRDPAPEIAEAFLALYGSSTGPIRQQVTQSLLSRPAWAAEFLRKFEAGDFLVQHLKPEDWQNVISEMTEADRALIIKIWGSVAPPTAEERLAEIRRFNNDLNAGTGNSANGKQLFGQHCATCHQLHGEGFKVGPDLTHVNRKDRDYLLIQLVDPNAIIRKEFLAYVAATTDGRVSTGLLVNQNAAELTLLAAKEQKTTVAVADLEELRESRASLMPENILKPFKPQELRDLFAYLQHNP